MELERYMSWRPEIIIGGITFVDVGIAADLLEYDVSHLKKMAREGTIPGKKIPEGATTGKWYFDIEAVRRALYGLPTINIKSNTYRKKAR